MQHLDEGTIHAWLDGALDAAEGARIERHVADCAACSEAVAEARGMIAGASRIVAALDVVPGNVIPRQAGNAKLRGWLSRSLRFSPMWTAIAATLLVAAGATLTVRRGGNRQDPVPTPVASATDAAAANAPRVVVAPASAPAAQTATSQPSDQPSEKKTVAVTVPSVATQKAAGRNEGTVPATASSNSAAGVQAAPAPVTAAAERINAMRASTREATAAKAAPVLSEVVVTSSAGGATRAVDSLKADTLKQTRTTALEPPRAASLAVSGFSAAQSARGALGFADAARRTSANECYRVISDSAVVGSAGVFLPRQFSLQQTAGTPPENVVRAIAPDGRPDSVLAGVRWERMTPTTTRLYVARAGSESALAFTLRFADGQVAASRSTATEPRTIDVARAVCRP